MTSLLPERKSIKNFRPDDTEGRHYFKQCAAILDRFFSAPERQEVAEYSSALIGGGGEGHARDAYVGLPHALSELWQLHQSFQRLIGMSVSRGEDVPTMSYFVDYVGRRGKTAGADAQTLAEQMVQARPFEAEDVSKEAFRNLLLEFAVLQHWLSAPDAAEAFKQLQASQRRQARGLFSDMNLPLLATGRDHTDAQEFSVFRHAVTTAYEELQKTLGVNIPAEAVKELVEHPVTATLSRANLDDIRVQFFKLPVEERTSFAARFIMPRSAAGMDGPRKS